MRQTIATEAMAEVAKLLVRARQEMDQDSQANLYEEAIITLMDAIELLAAIDAQMPKHERGSGKPDS